MQRIQVGGTVGGQVRRGLGRGWGASRLAEPLHSGRGEV